MYGNASIHYLKYCLGLEGPHSQTTPAEKQMLRQYAKDAQSAVEIGVFEGVNTANIVEVMRPNGVLYGIDPFFKGRLGVSYSKLITIAHLKKTKSISKVRLIEKLSFDALNDVPNELDFIFMDGDHSYEGIKKDWQDWSAKLKVGAFVALHDTSIPPHDPNVSRLGSYQYFQERIAQWPGFKVVDSIDSLNVLQKVA